MSVSDSSSALTNRQARFIDEYLLDLNATRAYGRAYPNSKPKSSNAQGARLLAQAAVQDAIMARRKESAERVGVTADRVRSELAKIAFANMMDFISITDDGEPYVDLSALTREQAAALHEFSVDDFVDGRSEDGREVKRVRIKLADKQRALELLGKDLQMFGGDAAPPSVIVNNNTQINVQPLELVQRIAFLLTQGAAEKEPEKT